MGDLDKVAEMRENFSDLLDVMQEPGNGGPTLEEETMQGASEQYPKEIIIRLATSLAAISWPTTSRKELLRDAVSILDHLHTQGVEIRFIKNGEG